MPTITLSVPDKMKKEMESLKGVNWSEVTRELLREKIKRLKLLRKVEESMKGSEQLSEDELIKLGRELKKGRFEKLKKGSA